MALTNFAKQKISEYLFEGSDSLSGYTAFYVELITSTGAVYNSGLSGDDRIGMNRNSIFWNAGSTSSNATELSSQANDSGSQVITSFNLYIGVLGGSTTLFASNEPLTQNITISNNETPIIPVGGLDIKFDYLSTDLESRIGHYVFEGADQLGSYSGIRFRQYNGGAYLGKEASLNRGSANFDYNTSSNYTYNKVDFDFGVQGGTSNVTLNNIRVAIGGIGISYQDLGNATMSSTSVAKGDTVRLKASTKAFKYYIS